jgi:nitrate reductase molybdenum cofactor assembly chaperone NarJ/NarW
MLRILNRAEVLSSNRPEVLELFADILDYPADGLAQKAAECAALIGPAQPEAAALLESFRSFAEDKSVGKLQEVYSGFFDLNSICHPYIGYQLFGENYKRSTFLVGLKKAYRDEGFESDPAEIADRLSIVLRYAAYSKGGEDVDDLLGRGVLPAVERMTTKPESAACQHDGAVDIDGDTGIERAKLDDLEDRKQLKGQSQGDQLAGGYLLALSEDYDAMDAGQKIAHPYHRALGALLLVLKFVREHQAGFQAMRLGAGDETICH